MRVVLWKSGDSSFLIRALARRGIDVVALLGARQRGVESYTAYELFFGAGREAPGREVPAPPHVSAAFLDEYARCAGRAGFNPVTLENNFRTGGIVHPDSVMDWAQLHLLAARRLLTAHRPDQFWICNHPQMGVDNAVVEMALQLGIRVLEFTPVPVPAKFRHWVRDGNGDCRAVPVRDFQRRDMQGFAPDLFYMRTVNRSAAEGRLDAALRMTRTAFRLKSPRRVLAALYEYAVERNRVRLPGWLERLDPNQAPAVPLRRRRRAMARDHRRAVERTVVDIPDREPFVYFPLHYEPEVVVSAVDRGFHNQVNAIQALRSALPDRWRILIKENPKQGYLHRDPAFYRRLAAMDGVAFVHGSTSASRLIQASSIVATINGTAGFEALRCGKPCVYFGQPWYESLTGAFRFDETVDLAALAGREIQQARIDAELADATEGFADGLVHHWMSAILPPGTSPERLAETTADSLVRISSAV